MSQVQKSILAASGVAAAALMVVAGSAMRDRIDIGGGKAPSQVASASTQNLFASRGNDVNVPAADFFFELSDKLKREYVEPVEDEQKLASGAVRGMVASLSDPKSLYMDKDEFSAFLNARQGTYEGIGADFDIVLPNRAKKAANPLQPTLNEETESDPEAQAQQALTSAPRLMVTNVLPGGPADRAGVRPGDYVYSIDGHWVYNSDLVLKFRAALDKFRAKKMTLAEISAMRKEYRAKFERAILPLRAKDKLSLGKSGTLQVVWERKGANRTTSIQRGVTQAPAFSANGSTIVLPFTQGAPEALRKAIADKTAVTIDLRHNTLGDFGVMRECLEVVAPKGQYGVIATERKETATPLAVKVGNANPPSMTLLVDQTTRGAAEIFALALATPGLAKLSGSQTGGDRTVIEIVQLPDGTGYTLATGEYKARPETAKSAVAAKGVRK